MNIPKNLMYTKSHEWIDMTGKTALVGITDYAQDSLGDIVYVNLPHVKDTFACGEVFADIESVKASSDIFSPVEGIVKRVNEMLEDAPEAINEDAYEAWLVEFSEVTNHDELLTADEYEAFLEEEAGA
ncbi:MAG: glycine cleavage system protein GcvH [Christensenellaceae bacterium]